MKRIRKNKIKLQTVEVFNPEGKSMGFFNEWEFNDLRVQIAEQQAEGYYISFEEVVYEITPQGDVLQWPHRLFNTQLKQYLQLIEARKKHRNNQPQP